jgi:hypothetical protein
MLRRRHAKPESTAPGRRKEVASPRWDATRAWVSLLELALDQEPTPVMLSTEPETRPFGGDIMPGVAPSVDVEFVALGVFHCHRVVIDALLA